MAWSDARPRIVEIVETLAVPTVTAYGVPPSFRHNETGSEDTRGKSRDFYIEVDVAGLNGPMVHPSHSRRRRLVTGSIFVDYEGLTDTAGFDLMAVSDAEVIGDALANPANWNRPASTIENLSLFGTEDISPIVVERGENGRARLIVPFECLYTHAAS